MLHASMDLAIGPTFLGIMLRISSLFPIFFLNAPESQSERNSVRTQRPRDRYTDYLGQSYDNKCTFFGGKPGEHVSVHACARFRLCTFSVRVRTTPIAYWVGSP